MLLFIFFLLIFNDIEPLVFCFVGVVLQAFSILGPYMERWGGVPVPLRCRVEGVEPISAFRWELDLLTTIEVSTQYFVSFDLFILQIII